MNRATLLLCLFGIVSSNLINNVAARLGGEGIIGGEKAVDQQFPYHVALIVNGKAACGGGIIGDKYILTAAHCFINDKGEFHNLPYTVVAGATDLNRHEGIEIAAETVYVHQGYQPPKLENDIAILKLEQGLGLGSDPSLGKLRLPKADAKYTGRTAVISGYGYTSIQTMSHPLVGIPIEIGGSTDNKLHYAKVNIIPNAECAKKNYPRPVYDSNICGHVEQRSSYKTEGVCSGDSGGPLVIDDNVLIGIVSSSPKGCDESEQAASYTRVSSHLSFIQKVLSGGSTSEIRVFKVPGSARPQQPSEDSEEFPFSSFLRSDGQDDDIFSIPPQFGNQFSEFPSFSSPFSPLAYQKRK